MLTRLQESVWRKRPELWVVLHHDNAHEHNALVSFQEFLAKKSLTKKWHPTYATELVPCNF
jgi:hypothetical protein